MTPVGMAPVEGVGLENEMPALPDVAALKPPTPEERLAASREKIRAALTRRAVEKQEGSQRRRAAGVWRGMRRVLSRVPLSKIAAGGAQRWWQHHPWRTTVEFGLDAADEVVRPVAQRHPWLLLAAALAGGALIARLRPWRSLTRSALLAGLLPAFRWSSLFDWVTSSLRQPTDEGAGNVPPQTDGSEPSQQQTQASSASSTPPVGEPPTSTAESQPAVAAPATPSRQTSGMPASSDATAVH